MFIFYDAPDDGIIPLTASTLLFHHLTWSRPTRATVFPQGTSSTASCLRPMHSTVRWTALVYTSFFSPDWGHSIELEVVAVKSHTC